MKGSKGFPNSSSYDQNALQKEGRACLRGPHPPTSDCSPNFPSKLYFKIFKRQGYESTSLPTLTS